MFNEQISQAYYILVQKTQAGLKALAEGMPGVFSPPDEKLYHPKHLRVGINNQIVEHSALVSLLVRKGLITWSELGAAYVIAYEAEVDRLEEEILRKTGVRVTLDVPPGFFEGSE